MSRALDPLPWPAGEDVMAGLGVLQAFVRPAHLRQALDWASAQPRGRRGRWGLALALLANHGRFVGQESLLGIRGLGTLRERLGVIGEEHLRAARQRGGVILLGFHVGPPGSGLALRLLGHPVTSLRGPAGHGPRTSSERQTRGWEGSIPVHDDEPTSWAIALHQARRILADNGVFHILADGARGAEAFRIPLPGGPIVIRSGWLALRRHTGATTLPLLAHRAGRRRIVTIHPALPSPSSDPDADGAACREVLGHLLEAYLRRFPEQCRATLWRP